MAKAKILEGLRLIDDRIVFHEGEEVYAFWFDGEGEESVDSPDRIPEESEDWTLHIQEIGKNGAGLWSPKEWEFDNIITDAIEITEPNWKPKRSE